MNHKLALRIFVNLLIIAGVLFAFVPSAGSLAADEPPTPISETLLEPTTEPTVVQIIVPTEVPPVEPTVVPTEVPPVEPIALPTEMPTEQQPTAPNTGFPDKSPNIATYPDGSISIDYVKPITLYSRNKYEPFRLTSSLPIAAQKKAPFSITYRSSGQKNSLGDTCLTFPTAAKTAFTYAANQWGARLTSKVTISIEACWANLGSYVLGHSAPMGYWANFSGASRTSTWYPYALADKLHGSNMNSGYDMSIAYANGYANQFYYGTSGYPGNKYDFAQIVMHEIAHGLGFTGSMYYYSGKGYWGYYDGSYRYLFPTIYDRFTSDKYSRYLLNTSVYPNPSTALGTVLRSNAIYFIGPYAKAGNGGKSVALYAPSTWSGGSSYSHLAESFNSTTSRMMTYSIPYGEAIHDPGPVTKGILRDEGWGIVY